MDDENGEFMEGAVVPGEGRSESEVATLIQGCWRETGS